MKRFFKYILYSLTGVVLFTACDDLNEPETFEKGNEFIAFTSLTAVVSEVDAVINVPVKVSALKGSPAITVTFEFDTVGLGKSAAIEGVDFELLNESKTLTVSDGFGFDTIKIKTMDNDVFTGQKTVNIILKTNSLGYDFGADNVMSLGISDDDHPFGWMLGDYSCTGNLWRAGGTPTWDMVLNPVADDIYSIQILGLVSAGGYGHPATADYAVAGKIIENEDGTYQIQFLMGQEIPTWGYGPCSLVGYAGPDGAVDIATGEAVTGDVIVGGDGSVSIKMHDEYGWYITDGSNVGLTLEVVVGDGTAVNTIWTRK